MHFNPNRAGVSTLLTACLGLGVVAPLTILTTGCSQPSKDKSSSYHANISSFLVAASVAPNFPTTSTATNTLDVTVGDAPYLVPNFSAIGGVATILPAPQGNPAIVSGVPVQVAPVTDTTNYTLAVTDQNGNKVTATATVNAWAAPNAAITADASVITETSGLTATVDNAPSSTFLWTAQNGTITGGANTATVTYTAGSAYKQNVILTCKVTNKAGKTDTQSVTIPVLAHPPAGFTYPMGKGSTTFYVNVPITTQVPILGMGDPFTLFTLDHSLPTGLTLDATSGIISGTPTALADAATYVITGANSGGTSTFAITFNVAAQPAIAFYADEPTIGLGGSTNLNYVVDDTIASITIDNGVATTPVSTASAKTGSFKVSPVANTTYTLTATLVGGGTKTVTLPVAVDATVLALDSFAPDKAAVDFGVPTLLRWSLEGTPTALAVNGQSVLGDSYLLVHPTRRSSYTLTGANGATGENTISQTVSVYARGLDVLAGNAVQGGGSNDGTGRQAQFNGVCALAVDSNHNLYAADQKNDLIRKITPQGVVTTIAGVPGVAVSADNADATKATFNAPTGIAVSSVGNIYVVDSGSSVLRILSHKGGVQTVTITPALSSAYSVAVASDDDTTAVVYVGASSSTGTVNKLSINLSTGAATSVQNWSTGLGKIYGLTYVPATKTLYLADDGKDCIRTIVNDSTTVNVVAGKSGSYGNRDGNALDGTALLNYPVAAAVDANGAIYIADEGNNIVRMVSGGQMTTIGGVSTNATGSNASNPGATDGPGNTALFRGPMGCVIDGTTLYVSESYFTAGMANNDIRAIDLSTTNYVTSTVAGSVPAVGSSDGVGAAAQFSAPFAMAVDAKRTTYVTDTANNTIRRITQDGTVKTIAGTVSTTGGYGEGTGSAALFKAPQGIAVDAAGNLYVADTGNHVIRMLTYDAVHDTYTSTPLAGTVSVSGGYAEGNGAAALFKSPRGLAVNSTGTLMFVADSANHRVRQLTRNGDGSWTSNNIAGTGTATAAGDKSGTVNVAGNVVTLSTPYGVAFDGVNNLYIAEYGGDAIKQVVLGPAGGPFTDAGSLASQIAGKGSGTGNYGFADGALGTSKVNYPQGIAVDANGNIFVADQGNNAVRLIQNLGGTWTMSTIVGAPAPGGATGTAPGSLPGTLWSPQSVATTPDGDLIITSNGGLVQATQPILPATN